MTPVPPGRLRESLAAVALFGSTAAFTLWQNARVAVLWDLTYLLDSSYRITLGQLPYRDFPFAHAPLTFMLHAAIIRIFGRVYFPHILCAALEAGAATLLTWRILLQLLPARAWLLAAVLAAPLIFLGIYGVYPHPIYDSDCILTLLLAIYLLQRASDFPLRNLIAGAACVPPLFFKQNIGLPFLLIVLIAVTSLGIIRRLHHASPAPQLCFLAGASAGLAAALLATHAAFGLRNYIHWTIQFAGQRRLPGLGVLAGIYRQTSLLWTIPAALAGFALLRIERIRSQAWVRPVALALLVAPFLWTLAALAIATDSDDRADQLLSLWPHLLLLAAVLAVASLRPRVLKANPTINTLLPLILLATIHGAFLSQQLWGSTYAIWPLLILLIAMLLTQVPTIARPLGAIVAATLVLCGGLYAISHERLSYIHLDGPESRATLPQLAGLTTPGPWIPEFEELVRFTEAEIPAGDGILLIPGENPLYFATGRIPQFPILLFDPATDPYTPQQTLDQARTHNIGWLIVTRNFQLTAPPQPDLPEVVRVLQQDFVPYRTLTNYDIYRRRPVSASTR